MFFFFQAEDGIRDDLVTGVQTCALPISRRPRHLVPDAGGARADGPDHRRRAGSRGGRGPPRSEERRVGKECRSRWWPYKEKKKITRSVTRASSDNTSTTRPQPPPCPTPR